MISVLLSSLFFKSFKVLGNLGMSIQLVINLTQAWYTLQKSTCREESSKWR